MASAERIGAVVDHPSEKVGQRAPFGQRKRGTDGGVKSVYQKR